MLEKYTKDSSGFSFMELMVVIAMIGILSAVALPGLLRALPEQRLKNAARNLYADMQRARLLAVRENRPISVRFNNGDNFYYFDDNDDSGFTAGEFRRNLSEDGDVSFGKGKAIKDWENPANNLPTSPTDNIVFSSTGEAAFDSGLTRSIILLQNQNQDVSYAVITKQFGSVQIRRFNGTKWDD
jgi:type IV fimbrial biogenesis protein FimT